ncbi:hypothetical protein [Thermoflavifilum thermophilum]|uniref:hypothetical protein n=1 Tax=Thermoflavifilum thermophilum TaxID=1393122 RepID=UPI0011609768|nr:hypothetical protein [Thermoflavifilum thermophilum]
MWRYVGRAKNNSTRFYSIDPKQNVEESGYVVNGNNPVMWSDPEGDCPWCDAIVDLGFILYDVGEIGYDYFTEGKVDPVNVAALSADVGALFCLMLQEPACK